MTGRTDSSAFLFATCQVGAEAALKAEVARLEPEYRFSYSRPGFVTFKAPADSAAKIAAGLPLVFARTSGICLGQIVGNWAPELAEELVQRTRKLAWNHLHVWPRDTLPPGKFGFEPGHTPLSREAESMIRRGLSRCDDTAPRLPLLDQPVREGDACLDCVLVEELQWWFGLHIVHDPPSRWSGGFFPMSLPDRAISRAYLKIAEALAWTELPIRSGELVAEIGCAPGGASQFLLDRGLHVLGVDPADVDARVAGNPHFTHLRKRGAEVRQRDYRKVKWLFADLNAPPECTLATLERIVTHAEARVRGIVMMLKLLRWEMADDLPNHLQRIRGWGYPRVLARQLHTNRQEVCVAAFRTT